MPFTIEALLGGLLALLAAILAWVWNRSTSAQDDLGEALEECRTTHAGELTKLRAELHALELRVAQETVTKSDMAAMEERLAAAMASTLKPVADDVALIKRTFMEIRSR